ncbi:MAG TPA: adenylyl-sulfate kinase [Polyangiaceae bacterium]
MSHGVVVWITGLPSSGKSTFAEKTRDALAGSAIPACLLDGDAVRASLVPTPGYSPEERASFYETLARLAALIARQGFVVLVPATAHRRTFRDLAERFVPTWWKSATHAQAATSLRNRRTA